MRPTRPLAALLLALGLAAPLRAATPARPNVLFIAVDDLRDWVGYFGHNPQSKTPNYDRLARMGTAFTRAYCASPVCNPSRAALMSGMRASTTAVYENNVDFRPLIPPEKMLTATFRQAGYYVHGSGKIYHEAYRRPTEWDHYLEKEGGYPRVPAGQSDGVGGIKFAPLDCNDNQIPDWAIADYGIASLGKNTTSRSSSPSASTSRTCPGTCRASGSTCSRSTASSCRLTSRTT
jgi:hypothetical protein